MEHDTKSRANIDIDEVIINFRDDQGKWSLL